MGDAQLREVNTDLFVVHISLSRDQTVPGAAGATKAVEISLRE
jgi:hypothetical protein